MQQLQAKHMLTAMTHLCFQCDAAAAFHVYGRVGAVGLDVDIRVKGICTNHPTRRACTAADEHDEFMDVVALNYNFDLHIIENPAVHACTARSPVVNVSIARNPCSSSRTNFEQNLLRQQLT